MDSSRLGMVGRFALVLLAVFVLGAMVASAAQADPTRAPVWKVGGKVLGANETRELTAKIPEKASLELEAPGSKIKVTCHKVELARGSFIANEGGTNGKAVSEFVAEFKECEVEGNGKPCKVVEPVVTKKIRSELVLNDTEPGFGNNILVEFNPRTAKEFVKLEFSGTGCKFLNTTVTELALAILWSDKTTSGEERGIELGEKPREETSYVLKFPDEPKSIWFWSNPLKTFALFKPTQLKGFNETVKLNGEVLFLLSNGSAFGISETGK